MITCQHRCDTNPTLIHLHPQVSAALWNQQHKQIQSDFSKTFNFKKSGFDLTRIILNPQISENSLPSREFWAADQRGITHSITHVSTRGSITDRPGPHAHSRSRLDPGVLHSARLRSARQTQNSYVDLKRRWAGSPPRTGSSQLIPHPAADPETESVQTGSLTCRTWAQSELTSERLRATGRRASQNALQNKIQLLCKWTSSPASHGWLLVIRLLNHTR